MNRWLVRGQLPISVVVGGAKDALTAEKTTGRRTGQRNLRKRSTIQLRTDSLANSAEETVPD